MRVSVEWDPTRPKWRQIYAEIRGRIESGELQPRDRLSEFALVEQYGVARETVRKALKALRDDGWIYTEHGMGSFVSEREHWPSAD
jgi:GntR family transcriptional regulator